MMIIQQIVLICVLALFSVVTSNTENACRALGETCNVNKICCNGCCENGACINSTSCQLSLICGNKYCEEEFACFQSGALCTQEKCNAEPKCRSIPNVFLNETDDPCQHVKCKPGQICQTQVYPCFWQPCPQEVDCVNYTDPCVNTTCPEGKVCNADNSKPPKAHCIASNPCKQFTCYEDSVCHRDPNNESLAICVPLHSYCQNKQCPDGYVCGIVQIECPALPCPHKSKCIPNDTNPCAYTSCPVGTRCITNPYNPASAICVYPDPCVNTTCPNNTVCQRDDNNATQAKCVAFGEICAKANCSRGYECTVEVTQCLIPPCPAIGKCVKINPCSTKVCPNDTNCITDPSDDTNALCVYPDPCASHSCPYDSVCQRDEENPCQAKCVPVRNFCKNVTCITCPDGYVCGAEQLPCYVTPCPYTAKCIRNDTNPCANTSCPEGTSCITNPYNPALAICVYPDPCVNTTCPNNTVCQRDDKNATSAKCIPFSEICAAANCSKGYNCTVEVTQCLIPPCPAVGKCILTDPCSQIVCTTGSECVINPSNTSQVSCVYSNPCLNTVCPEDSVCQRDDLNPLLPECVAIKEICARARCQHNFSCVLKPVQCLIPPCPFVGECVDPCAGISCAPGYQLTIKNETCRYLSCPKCCECQPINYCANVTCELGKICVQSISDPTKTDCVIHNPCTGVRCATGTKCVATKQCNITSCSVVAKCVSDVDPCSNILCGFWQKCFHTYSDNFCLFLPCQPNTVCQKYFDYPCSYYYYCKSSEECIVLQGQAVCRRRLT